MDIEKIINHLKENIISLLFSIIGSEIILYSVQREFSFIYSAIVLILVITIYILFDKVVELDKNGPILYLGVAVTVFLLSFFTIRIDSLTGTGFYRWFIGGGNTIEKNPIYEITSLVIIPFVFTSLSYYFSVTVSRMLMMFLISFIALTLNIKGVYRVNSWYIFIFIVLLFMLFIVRTRNENIVKDSIIKINGKYIIYIGTIFITTLLAISFIIPKPDKLPVIGGLEEFKGFVQGFVRNSEKGSGLADDNANRNIDEPMNFDSNKILYTFTGKNPEYLVDKSFDVYVKNEWVQQSKALKDNENIISYNRKSDIKLTMELINEVGNLKGELAKINELKWNVIDQNYITLKAESILSRKIIHPSKVVKVTLLKDSNKEVYVNGFNEIYLGGRSFLKTQEEYETQYISDVPENNSKEEAIMRYFNEDRYLQFFKDNFDTRYIDLANNILSDINERYMDIGGNVTSRTKELAVNITKDAQSNYDKAKVIESYFTSGDFTYNLDLPKHEGYSDYTDYFIFEGKEGYCVQYATAMTLMCRAAGIPARYVEGSLITDKDYNNVTNRYEVKESDGHAFVEVYIPGYGWKIFDPTPSTTEDSELAPEVQSDNKESTKNVISFKKIIIVASVVSLILICLVIGIIIFKVTERSRYMKKIFKMSNEEAFEEIMINTIMLLEKCDMKPYLRDTELTFSVRVDKRLNLGFEELMKRYYEYRYGNKNIENEILARAIKINESIYEYIKS